MQFQSIYDVENKQRLNLSSYAHDILLHDVGAVQPENTLKRGAGEISSNIVNHIFHMFFQDAESSILLALRKKKQELDALFAQMNDETARQQAFNFCLEAYERELVEASVRRQKTKGYALSVRINHDNLEYLASEEGRAEGKWYQDQIGKYFKALLEEYCELPYVTRERIYYKDILDTISLAILEKKQLKLILHGGNAENQGDKNHVLYVKPWECLDDSAHTYNYLVGMMSLPQEAIWRIGVVRLTSIQKCVRISRSGYLDAEEKRAIQEAIKKKGIQFLPEQGTLRRIIVELTPEGEKMYRKILHLRPLYVSKNGARYEFSCTQRQADNYFFKFGHHVKIIEPETMAQSFCRRYRLAAKQYEGGE